VTTPESTEHKVPAEIRHFEELRRAASEIYGPDPDGELRATLGSIDASLARIADTLEVAVGLSASRRGAPE
jgi:hypothetical protein